jgi:cysteinyl-tRNA synthetase
LAIAVLFELANEINKTRSATLARQLLGLAGIVGLLQRAPQQFLHAGLANADDGDLETFVAEQIAARVDAKKTRNFAEADRIRAALLEKGIILEDKPGGLTEWRRA